MLAGVPRRLRRRRRGPVDRRLVRPAQWVGRRQGRHRGDGRPVGRQGRVARVHVGHVPSHHQGRAESPIGVEEQGSQQRSGHGRPRGREECSAGRWLRVLHKHLCTLAHGRGGSLWHPVYSQIVVKCNNKRINCAWHTVVLTPGCS